MDVPKNNSNFPYSATKYNSLNTKIIIKNGKFNCKLKQQTSWEQARLSFTLSVTRLQDGRVLSDHCSQGVHIAISCCLVNHSQVDLFCCISCREGARPWVNREQVQVINSENYDTCLTEFKWLCNLEWNEVYLNSTVVFVSHLKLAFHHNFFQKLSNIDTQRT